MKTLFSITALATGLFVVVHAALTPDGGIMFSYPAVPLALGMIGVGLCKRAKEVARAKAREQM